MEFHFDNFQPEPKNMCVTNANLKLKPSKQKQIIFDKAKSQLTWKMNTNMKKNISYNLARVLKGP